MVLLQDRMPAVRYGRCVSSSWAQPEPGAVDLTTEPSATKALSRCDGPIPVTTQLIFRGPGTPLKTCMSESLWQ